MVQSAFTPDGMPTFGTSHEAQSAFRPDGMPTFGTAHEAAPAHGHQRIEVNVGSSWFRAESNRLEQERRAALTLPAICAAVDQLWRMGGCPSRRWTNCREACNAPGLPEEVLDFPPCDGSLFVPQLQGHDVAVLDQAAMRPQVGDRVTILEENSLGTFEPARAGTRGLHGVVIGVDSLRRGPPRFQVELEDRRVFFYEGDWLDKGGRPAKGNAVRIVTESSQAAGALLQLGDAVRILQDNPDGHYDERRRGTLGKLGLVVGDDGSDLPFEVEVDAGAGTRRRLFYKAGWLLKAPPDRLRLLAPLEGGSLLPKEILGEYTLEMGQDVRGFPTWDKPATGHVEAGIEVHHVMRTDRRGRWSVVRMPANFALVVSRGHRGLAPHLVAQWGVIRSGLFQPVELTVQALNPPVKPPTPKPKQKGCPKCGPCCAACSNYWPEEKPDEEQKHWVEPEAMVHAGAASAAAAAAEAARRRSLYEERRWARLINYGPTTGPSCNGGCAVFHGWDTTHEGRVFQGSLDNAYLVEALNAISLRPKLARRLFYCWSVEFSVYAVRLFKNGTWVCVEIDDFVPCRYPSEGDGNHPLCCYSEHFPEVLWPSLVEKAYAKACTIRVESEDGGEIAAGGWQAVCGGGRVDEALVDLTGGVASSFSTRDIAPDRLFIYLYELQRDCLFVCRVHIDNCTKNGVLLNPYAHHAVNRAAHHEGECFVQIFCAAESGVHSAGLDRLLVPEALNHLYPEKGADGFFWLNIYDFQYYFDTIFECRLTNSPDVGLDGMPPSRLPNAGLPAQGVPVMLDKKLPETDLLVRRGASRAGIPVVEPLDEQPIFFEWVFANPGIVSERTPAEFDIVLPHTPCEVVATVEQMCPRIAQVGLYRKPQAAILLKVYEHLNDNVYASTLICKSAWKPVRGAMVAFKSLQGGTFKVVAEMLEEERCERLIMRCYTSVSSAMVTASNGMRKHLLAKPEGPPMAIKWTFVGCVDASKLPRVDLPMAPEEDLDRMRQREVREQCSLM